jgi:L-ascorbate metabolism protein UlaG (beta-lactamase superfamily)
MLVKIHVYSVRTKEYTVNMKISGLFSVALFALFNVLGCATLRNYPESPQFREGQFSNPTPTEKPDFFQVANLILFGRNGKWPEERLRPTHTPAFANGIPAGEVEVTFVGHSTFLLRFRGLHVLTDPVWSERVGPWSWAGPLRARDPGIAWAELPKIDVVLVSHDHYDHLDVPTLKRLTERDAPLIVAPLGVGDYLRKSGIERVVELDWWQTHSIGPDARVVLTPAQHNSGRWGVDADRRLWGSFWITAEKTSVYFAGDTAYSPHFQEIRKKLGAPDLALIPIGAYLPQKMMDRFHLNPAQAAQAFLDLGARSGLAAHFGAFQISNEDFDAPGKDLEKARVALGILPDRFRVPSEGETLRFRGPE